MKPGIHQLNELLERYCEAFDKAVQEKNVCLPDASLFFPQLLRVWSASDFVADFSIQYPERLLELVTSGDLDAQYAPETYCNRLAQQEPPSPGLKNFPGQALALPHKGGGDKKVLLRRFRQREMVRIAWRDILGSSSIEETLLDTSLLAEACIQFAAANLYGELSEQHGVPYGSDKQPLSLIVLALGKLGGRELNFSSDVDLVFAYLENGTTEGKGTSLSHDAFFTRLAQRLVGVLNEATEDGFVFRVDLRLRPYGDEGPIVMSFESLENYYTAEGREWERYALVKAHPITGSETEKTAVMALLRPFVYRRYIDFSVLAALRDLKKTIAQEVKRKGQEQHLKLGAGGIREIEFIVQSFQLIYGGRRPQLQTPSIYRVFKILNQKKMLDSDSLAALQTAYSFLRTLENRLQERQDRQVHSLPGDALEKERLCVSLGFKTWESLHILLQSHQQVVQALFSESVMPKEENEPDDSLLSLDLLWKGRLEKDAATEVLSAIGFKNAEECLARLNALRCGGRYRTLSARSAKNVERFMPRFLLEIGKTEDPDTTLMRTLMVLEALLRRTVYLVLLLENPQALTHWITLCARSQWIVEKLSAMPVLLDELLDVRQLYQVVPKHKLRSEVIANLALFKNANDEESWRNRLVEFKQSRFLRIAAAELMGKLTSEAAGVALSNLAEVVLEQVLERAWKASVIRYGKPPFATGGQKGIGIVAYGRWGGCNLSYTSDLDVVFLCEDGAMEGTTDGPKKIPATEFYYRLVQKVLQGCHCLTPSGSLYTLDTRLRPSGEGLPLVTVASFLRYQQHSAALWEHQALIKARLVCGSRRLQQVFLKIRRGIIFCERPQEALREKICAMRQKMLAHLDKSKENLFDLKQGEGGMIDIEFIVQYGVLAWGYKHPELARHTRTIRLLSAFVRTGLMPPVQVECLLGAYVTYTKILHQLMLNQAPLLAPLSMVSGIQAQVREIWRRLFDEQEMHA